MITGKLMVDLEEGGGGVIDRRSKYIYHCLIVFCVKSNLKKIEANKICPYFEK